MGDHTNGKMSVSGEQTNASVSGAPGLTAFWTGAAQDARAFTADDLRAQTMPDPTAMLPWVDQDHATDAVRSVATEEAGGIERLGHLQQVAGSVENAVAPWAPRTNGKQRKADEDARVARQQELNGYKSKPGPIVRDDEKPVLWGMNPRMPGTPPRAYTLTVEPVLPAWITWWGDPEFARRNVYWQQFAEAVADGNQRHATMRPALIRYQNAHEDPRLGALGVRVGDRPIDVRALIEHQRVPNEGGVDVGGLFAGDDGTLALEAGDQEAIERARDAVLGGQGTIQATGDATSVADRAMDAATVKVRIAASAAREAALELQGALRRVEAIFSRRHAEDVKRDLEGAQRRLANARAVVEGLFRVASLVAHVAEGSAGDAIEKVGELVGDLVSLSAKDEIASLGRNLELAELQTTTLLDTATIDSYNAALESASGARDGVESARISMLGALGNRRAAYNAFGASTRAETSVSAGRKHDTVAPPDGSARIGGMLSAIPLVEEARDQARALVRDGEGIPTSEAATRGCGIASAHNHPVVAPFLAAADELHAVETMARRDERTWQERLDSLVQVKTFILGKKAGE